MKTYIFLLMIMVTSQCFGEEKYRGGAFFVSPGLSYQRGPWVELNCMYGNAGCNSMSIYGGGIRLGAEGNFRKDHFIIAPKIGVEGWYNFLCARFSVAAYTYQKKTDMRLLPEIGVSAGGLISLCYGRNIGISSYRDPLVSKHKITLSINLSKAFGEL